MAIQFCKTCQSNGVNTRVEWRPNPDKPGKNKPFDIDKNEWHSPCPYWKPDPSKKKFTYTPTNDQAKQIVQEYKQKFPDDNEHLKKIELGISQQIEIATQAVLLQRDTIRLAKGEEIEVILAQKDEEIAGLKEALRQQGLTDGKGNKV